MKRRHIPPLDMSYPSSQRFIPKIRLTKQVSSHVSIFRAKLDSSATKIVEKVSSNRFINRRTLPYRKLFMYWSISIENYPKVLRQRTSWLVGEERGPISSSTELGYRLIDSWKWCICSGVTKVAQMETLIDFSLSLSKDFSINVFVVCWRGPECRCSGKDLPFAIRFN